MAAGSSAPSESRLWYHLGPPRYCRRSSDTSVSRRMKCWSPASSARRAAGTVPSRRTGSASADRGFSGSTARKSSWVSVCQDQRRLRARSLSGRRGSGRTGRTVNRRMAFTYPTFTGDVRIRGDARRWAPSPSPSTVASGRPARPRRATGAGVVAGAGPVRPDRPRPGRCTVCALPLRPPGSPRSRRPHRHPWSRSPHGPDAPVSYPSVTGDMADFPSARGLVAPRPTGKAAEVPAWRPGDRRAAHGACTGGNEELTHRRVGRPKTVGRLPR